MHLLKLLLLFGLSPQDHINRICGIAWSPNQQKLAVATADRAIILFDENGEKRDKFSTKPSDPANGKTSYTIRAIAFSPDSSKLAVAQSDNIVYVYKLGTSWTEKKVICNKFPQPSSITAMLWLTDGPIIVGKLISIDSWHSARVSEMNWKKCSFWNWHFAIQSFAWWLSRHLSLKSMQV